MVVVLNRKKRKVLLLVRLQFNGTSI
jgi:hypothetical protein